MVSFLTRLYGPISLHIKGATTSAAFWAVGGDLNNLSSVFGFGSYAFAANMSNGCQTVTEICITPATFYLFTEVQLISAHAVFRPKMQSDICF